MSEIVPVTDVVEEAAVWSRNVGDYYVQKLPFLDERFLCMVLETNSWGVIVQTKITLHPQEDIAVFDFVRGQSMMSHKDFDEFLTKNSAVLTDSRDPVTVELTLRDYRIYLTDTAGPDALRLPASKAEIEHAELISHCSRTGVVPPPLASFKSRGIHWLEQGSSGKHLVAKLWDPDQKTWIYPDGRPDLTAQIAFGIVRYHSTAHVYSASHDTASITDAVEQVLSDLAARSLMFDRKRLGKRLRELFCALTTDGKTLPCKYQYSYCVGPSRPTGGSENEKFFLGIILSDAGNIAYRFSISMADENFIDMLHFQSDAVENYLNKNEGDVVESYLKKIGRRKPPKQKK